MKSQLDFADSPTDYQLPALPDGINLEGVVEGATSDGDSEEFSASTATEFDHFTNFGFDKFDMLQQVRLFLHKQ
jgi:hypothetical protein